MASEQFTREGSSRIPDVIQRNRTKDGRRDRELIQWRVPDLGFIEMYINPQSLSIVEKKVISKKRTKGGYIVQYWGEELPVITLRGNTGSSGIEGINVLRDVYRAEQNSFTQVAQSLAERINSTSAVGSIANVIGNTAGQSAGDIAGNVAGATLGGLLGLNAAPPLLPTLGSLAVAVEMYYQGWVFKGYFDSFTINEGTSEGVGIFTYDLSFLVLDRRGTRFNFMPWHRNPVTSGNGNGAVYTNADSDNTPFSFGGEE